MGFRQFTLAKVMFALAAAAIALGYRFPTERYITPQRGLGYALGIAGGTMMLLLLMYPARKRARWLAFIGTVKRWFQAHMALGVLGPICILFHANFRLGATNSNVALWSMLIVAASGLVGRYFYTQIHMGLHGRRATHAELIAASRHLREQSTSIAFMPHLQERLERAEADLLRAGGPALLWFWRPVVLRWHQGRRARALRRYIKRELSTAAEGSPTIAAHQVRLRGVAFDYVDRRLRAVRRVAELESFERLFSWWHVLHLPLFFMLLVAGVVHVVAVHVY